MEDFPLLFLFFIIYLVVSASSGKKKKQKQKRFPGRQGPMRTRAQGEQADARARERDARTMEGFHTAFSDSPGPKRCEERRIHLHDVTDEQMQRAGEGEDPCHAGGAIDAPDPAFEIREEAQPDFRQEVLRGVIMSEILTRPCERRAVQRSRQRTNGY